MIINSDFKSTALNNEPSVGSCPPVDCSFHFKHVSVSEVPSALKKKKKKLQDYLEIMYSGKGV